MDQEKVSHDKQKHGTREKKEIQIYIIANHALLNFQSNHFVTWASIGCSFALPLRNLHPLTTGQRFFLSHFNCLKKRNHIFKVTSRLLHSTSIHNARFHRHDTCLNATYMPAL